MSLVSLLELPMTVAGMLVFQGLLAVILCTLVGIAYHRRRSLPYLFVWIATATLVVESLAGIVGLVLSLNPFLHLIIDHGLDILLIGMVLAAIYSARRAAKTRDTTHEHV